LNLLQSCTHRPPCTACPRLGEAGIARVARDALDELAHAHGLPDVAVISGSGTAFRLRARLAIRGRVGSPKIGLFVGGTHRVVHVPGCGVQHPLINRAAAVVRRALAETRVSCYSENADKGHARYLQVAVERSSQSAQVVLVANCTDPAPLAACFALIRERLGPELHSLWFSANTGRGNTILGPTLAPVCGPGSIVESFGGAAVHYPPGAFGQSNPEVAQLLIDHVRELIPPGARVAEFYAGVGAIGLSILGRVGALSMNEISPHSLAGLGLGLAGLDPARRARITVVPGAAGEACAMAGGADVVIADPPRKGLDPELTAQLASQPPGSFLYISCGLESLLEDAARLTAGGRLRLAALTAFNLLPYTAHVETVARFERCS
jgi:23S rRNA (uracil1939-C5)-methyltransferase